MDNNFSDDFLIKKNTTFDLKVTIPNIAGASAKTKGHNCWSSKKINCACCKTNYMRKQANLC